MVFYVLRRAFSGIVLALLVTLITFLLLSLSFDSIVRTLLGDGGTPDAIAGLKQYLGYDQPVIIQYLTWLGNAVRGDFGVSLFTSQPVAPAVISRLGVTLSIVLVSLFFTVVLSVILGVWAAYRGGIADRVAQGLSLFGYLVPALLLAVGLVLVFAVNLKWLPAGGFTPLGEDPTAWARSITLPVIVLTIGGTAGLTAQIRGSMLDELRKDYVRTLRTRGVSTHAIVLQHALRNAAGPALTVLSLQFIGMLGGALIIENVFALPGFGAFSFNAALKGDIPLIMGVTVFGVLLVVGVNLLVDVLNGWLNPKARTF